MSEKMTLNFSWAVNYGIKEEMHRDPDVCLFGEEVATIGGAFGQNRGLLDEFGPERVQDTPISEATIVAMAIGAAIEGLRPICEIMFMNFLTLCADEIYNQAAKMRWMFGGQFQVPMVIKTVTAGGWGAGAHHSSSLEAWFAHTPGLKVVMPATPYDGKGLIKSAIRDDNPVLFIEPLASYRIKEEIPTEEYLVPIGKAVVKKEGNDITILSVGRMLQRAQQAVDTLAQNGINAELIDLLTVNPLDMETIYQSVKKTRRLIIIHEAQKICGIGAEIAADVSENLHEYLSAPVKRIGSHFAHMGTNQPAMDEAYLPQSNDVVKAAKDMLNYK